VKCSESNVEMNDLFYVVGGHPSLGHIDQAPMG
jgi:hypothetical protein